MAVQASGSPKVYGMIPHPFYAEDQPLAHAILTTHVLHRGFQVGAYTGFCLSMARVGWELGGTNPTFSSALPQIFGPRVKRIVGISGLCGTGLLGLALVGLMRGKEEIEWKDRSWRLLENEGEVQRDIWSVGGTVLGLMVAARRGKNPTAMQMSAMGNGMRMLGAAGMGNLAGVLGHSVWKGIRKDYGLMQKQMS